MSITATAFNGNELIIRVPILIEATDVFMYPMLIAKRAFQNSTARRNFIHVVQPQDGVYCNWYTQPISKDVFSGSSPA